MIRLVFLLALAFIIFKFYTNPLQNRFFIKRSFVSGVLVTIIILLILLLYIYLPLRNDPNYADDFALESILQMAFFIGGPFIILGGVIGLIIGWIIEKRKSLNNFQSKNRSSL